MSTLKDVERIAKRNGFVKSLEEYGFVKKGAFSFYRIRGDIFDVISANVLSSGESLRVFCYCWVPEVNPGYDIKDFPKWTSIIVGGSIGWEKGFPFREKIWTIGTQEQITAALIDVLNVLEQVALPWVDRVIDRRSFVNNVDVNVTKREEWPDRRKSLLGE